MPEEAMKTATDGSKEKNGTLSMPERQLGYVREGFRGLSLVKAGGYG
jgi:hypothetical protein